VLAAYVALHIRAGLAEDAHWSRQQVLAGHGLRLSLSSRDWETTQPYAAVAPAGVTRGNTVSPRLAEGATAARHEEFSGWAAPRSVAING
jgi:hypothetical protein